MRKIAFVGIFSHSRYTYADSMHHCDGMPRRSGMKLDNLLELYDATGNKGNMIHGEAPSRIIESNRNQSGYISMKLLVESGWSHERISEELSNKFDLVVFSMANAVRPNFDPGGTAEIMNGLRTECIVLGLGMQNPLPQTTEPLHPNLIKLLEVCNQKASVFGVRGLATESWLKSVGFDRAKALGCPSMYVYPLNILNISPPDPSQIKSAITGGYINGRVPRSSAIIELFKGFNAHYVMQEEMFNWKMQGLLDLEQDIYNDATGEVYKNAINPVLEEIHDEKMPFSSYRWFQDPNAWRMFASSFDFYLGDRLHGGVVALQVGVPAIMMADDVRVIEVADFYRIPRISVAEAESMTLRQIVAERLSASSIDAFKETYSNRFHEFETTLREADIHLTIQANSKESSVTRQGSVPHIQKRPSLVKLIRRQLRRL